MKPRPGRLWWFFYGRPRRGFPWLLAGVLVAVVVFALIFAIPGGADFSRTVAVVAAGLLLVTAAVLAVLAVFVPRRRR